MGRVKQSKSSPNDQQVSFRATDHGDSVLAGLKYLREKQKLFDVTFLVEGQKFQAHRVVLASCSDYFRAMFTDGLIECQRDIIPLNGVTAKGMKNLIDFAYSSKLLLDFDNVEDILLSANHVQMLPVLRACSDFLKQHMAIENCIDMLRLTDLLCIRKLKCDLLKFMCSNWTKVSVTQDFCTKLTANQFISILDSNMPMNCSETEILSTVVSWTMYDLPSRQQHFLPLLKHIQIQNISGSTLHAMTNKAEFERLLTPHPNFKNYFYMSCLELSPCLLESGLVNNRGFTKALVCVGGFSPNGGMTNDLRFYSHVTTSWKTFTTIPHIKQCNFGLSVLNNEMFVVGGCFNDQIQEVVHQYGFRYNPEKDTWKSIAPMNHERCRFYLGALGGKLYAIGGDPSASNDVSLDSAPCECFLPEENKWTAISPLPGNRSQHAGVVFQNALYISGGLQDADEDFYTSFFRYDPVSDSWTELSPMLSPRADHAMFIYEGHIYVAGGWHENPNQQRIMVADLDRYDHLADRWDTVTTVPDPRLYATYTVMDGKLHIVGGWINGNYQRKAQWIQTVEMDTFSIATKMMGQMEVWEHSSCSLYIPSCRQTDN
ncbi:kelch-like protein 26 isoform X3 [Ostrea edulis]|nr:kelch-like protein 26 isoform X3 [Ostrea edulis]XP_048747922.1 kelch-like protein 26 isoform X3 [Ostrea edulis]XP_048747927.1 kelch-like protein 26 isoform X3 [Ostrea edulis]XP_048747934.1 kelch-like protein 26 isoform X3 [Ostrea edulis]XP_048747940.1 kelch-like protein 26 isoform X3 [Ostrea edulis]XP_055997831.1 kelch-like protein 26 isoform X3 [Ostrea edulis]XP_055997906.1 kelch-like protein 26 isoform X3 [Ostrea edulis]